MAIFRQANSSGLTDVPGFEVAGIHCDIRGKEDGRLDLALIRSLRPASAAGVFTRNALAAAPVRLCRDVLAGGRPVRGLVVNSGNANACTGGQGLSDAMRMRALAADGLHCSEEAVFVCSTGRIGEPLPMERIDHGVAIAAGKLSAHGDAGLLAAEAILTSDTRRKVATYRMETPSGPVMLAGMAKGAGMIEPDMATMLAFLTTDADIEQTFLQEMLREAVDDSFNRITVDGDASTNDSVLLLANGASGITVVRESETAPAFKEALEALCRDLALMIVGDGERTTKVVEIRVSGASSDEDARRAGRAVANSLLVKSSWFGNDPNWGRIMDALGYSGALLDEQSVRIAYGDWESGPAADAFARGRVLTGNRATWKAIVAADRFRIEIDLGKGGASYRIWSTDLTEGYVNFNKSE
jgi:glutamate N-acetyltransferase/amino-acid N-acetyltransferase